jgi:hypothetical protein
MAMMFDHHNFLVMSVHVAVMVTILLDDDGILSFRRRGDWYCNSESRSPATICRAPLKST